MVKEAKLPKREHPCPHCLAGFRSPSTRDAHARAVHKKWRDFKCPHCPGVAFGRSNHLKTHIETVHEKRRDHVCGYCKGVAFGRASTLKAHISTIHLKVKRSRGAK